MMRAMTGRMRMAASANIATLSPMPSSPAPSSCSMNLGSSGTSIPTYTKKAPVAAVTARNSFVTRRGRDMSNMLQCATTSQRARMPDATDFTLGGHLSEAGWPLALVWWVDKHA